jgi:hypothetical protein
MKTILSILSGTNETPQQGRLCVFDHAWRDLVCFWQKLFAPCKHGVIRLATTGLSQCATVTFDSFL